MLEMKEDDNDDAMPGMKEEDNDNIRLHMKK